MKNITITDILNATDGILLKGNKALTVSDVSIDSKQIKATGSTLFIPLIGERVDAHRYVRNAIENGAIGVIISNDSKDVLEELEASGADVIIKVSETKKALQDIAIYYRQMLDVKLVAITGSVGKTTTRELTAAALSPFGSDNVYQTVGNRNSQTGVPLTVMDITSEKMAVVELGMSEEGEIEIIAGIAKPDVAIITNIGVAHLMQLKTQANICKEKMSITKGLKEDGCIFLNADDPFQRDYSQYLKHKVYFYGEDIISDFRISNAVQTTSGMEFDYTIPDGNTYKVKLSAMGIHNVRNAAAAMGAAIILGAEPQQVVDSMRDFGGVKMRQQIINKDNYTIIDDSYNANPDSMKAGLKVLADYKVIENGRRIALLADMKELGADDEIRFHKEMGEYVAGLGIDILITVGTLAAYISDEAACNEPKLMVKHVADNDEAAKFLRQSIKSNDVLFVKGSRSMALDKVIEQI